MFHIPVTPTVSTITSRTCGLITRETVFRERSDSYIDRRLRSRKQVESPADYDVDLFVIGAE